MTVATPTNLIKNDNSLRLTFNNCHRAITRDLPYLNRKYGGNRELPKIAARAKCSACGKKGSNVTFIAGELNI